MTTYQFFITTWEWNPTPLLLCALVLMGYFLAFGLRGRPLYLAVALIVFLVALMSPLSALADGYLFSAHMVQHILLVLIIPALFLLSLPSSFFLPRPIKTLAHPFIGWIAGVGAMWLWHAPTLCNAATTLKAVSVIQTISLLLMGSVFWWQVLPPRERRGEEGETDNEGDPRSNQAPKKKCNSHRQTGREIGRPWEMFRRQRVPAWVGDG